MRRGGFVRGSWWWHGTAMSEANRERVGIMGENNSGGYVRAGFSPLTIALLAHRFAPRPISPLRWAWIIAVPLKPVSAIEASVAVCHTVLLLLIRHLRIEGGDAKIIKPLRRHAERRVSLDRRRQHRPLGSVSVRTHHGGRAQTSNHWAHSTILLLRNSVASRRRGMLVEEVVAATPESTTTAPLLP